MKNLKKVLAMVLAFACTFTMFASAKVYEDVQPGSDYSEAITMLSDLGIIQGRSENKYEPESTITRAEACALIARLLTGDPNVQNFGGAQNFTDVVKGSWMESPIGYCVANGITVGVGKGKFEPNRPINDQEFITMMVRALGYETPDMKQNYPFSYMTAANAIGLRHNTNMMANTDALRGEDAQVIYNAMFVDYAKGVKMINTTHGTSVEKYKTLAESVWGLDRAALGTFNGKDDEDVTLTNCKAHTWVIVGADKKEEGRVLAYPIDDDTTDIYESDIKDHKNGTKFVPYSFKYEGDADALKGYQVELWGAGKHGTPTWEKDGKDGKFVYSDEWNIKAIKTVAGQTKYDYDASKADAKSDNGTIEMDEKKLELDSVADNANKVVAKNTTETPLTTYLSKAKYNGETVVKDKAVEKALNVRDGAQYKLMDWDSDGHIDWVVVDEAHYYKVEDASSKRVTVTSMKVGNEEKETASDTQTWKIGDLNDEKDYKVKYEVPEGLKEGDILEVTYKTAYDKGEKCEVVTATATVVDAENHELDKVSTKDHLVLTFDGETVQLAEANDKADTIVPANPSKYEDFDEEELGTAFALYKNRNGFIVYSDYATDSANYLMVLDTDDGKNSVRGELGAMKVLTSDNKEENVEVVSDLKIDGDAKSKGYNKEDRSFDESKMVGNIYKYWKDADGKITKLDSMIDFDVKDSTAQSDKEYEYVAKNDRLTLKGSNQSYALKDAKVIFAVKPHDATTDYIQHKGNDLKVDADDVLAVKQADIPDIGKNEDTLNNTLDKNTAPSWIQNQVDTIAIDADKNKDINAAVLGVNNFNKFNAGSTKVGLVTNVSYDKGGVVSLDVATNGKVETLSSAEKVDFDDVVSVKDYQNNTTESVSGRNETINVGIMKGKNLKDALNKNGAYAEITTNADGKLTGVLFMDNKTDADGALGKVNNGNVVIGNYYQVSRKVIADVKEGSWMSVVEGSAVYADKDNFRSMDTKNTQKASNFTSDAAYYVIDGKPTRSDKEYTDNKATILDGFDGNPDVKAGEASAVKASVIRNNNNLGDTYNVADVATKIDKDGAGDVVAVYAYDDDMGEKEAINMASVEVKDASGKVVNTVKPGDVLTITAVVTHNHNTNMLDSIKVFKDGKEVATEKATVGYGSNSITATWTVPAYAFGEYMIKGAYGSTVFGGGAKITVDAGNAKFVASEIKLADKTTGTLVDNNKFQPVGNNAFYVFVGGDLQQTRTISSATPVTGLTAADFKVEVNYSERTIAQCVEQGQGYYYIELKDVDFKNAEAGKNIAISLRGDKAAAGLQNLTVEANTGATAQGGTVAQGSNTVEGVTNVGKVEQGANNFNTTAPTVTEVLVTPKTANGMAVTKLEQKDFDVKVKDAQGSDVSGVAYTVTEQSTAGVYKIAVTNPANLRNHTVEVTVNGKPITIAVPAAKVEVTVANPEKLTAKVNEAASASTTVTVTNGDKAQLKVWQKDGAYNTATTDVTDQATGLKVTVAAAGTITLGETPKAAGTVEVYVGVSAQDYAPVTITVAEADAPTLADGLKDVQQVAGVAATAGTKAKYTAIVTAHSADENVKVALKKGADVIVETDNVAIEKGNDNNTAKAIAKALQDKLTAVSNTDYTVTNDGSNNKIVVEAANAAQEVLSLELTSAGVSTKVEKDVSGGACVDGVAPTTGTKGTLTFTIPVGATENGNWKLTMETGKDVTVNLRANDTAEQIAQFIVDEVTKNTSTLKLTASKSGATVTITENTANEVFKDDVTTDVKFEKV